LLGEDTPPIAYSRARKISSQSTAKMIAIRRGSGRIAISYTASLIRLLLLEAKKILAVQFSFPSCLRFDRECGAIAIRGFDFRHFTANSVIFRI
jgi:hypothetical protein